MQRRTARGSVVALVVACLLSTVAPAAVGASSPPPGDTASRDTVAAASAATTSGVDAGAAAAARDRLATGEHFSCLVAVDGTVRCWGWNANGRLGNGGDERSVGPVRVVGITDAIAVTAGSNHACIIRAGGTVACWGLDVERPPNSPVHFISARPVQIAGVTGAVSIAAGAAHTCVVLVGGTAKCWGSDVSGQLGDGSVDEGDWDPTPSPVQDLSGAVAITAGGGHTCARLSNGTVRCWGGNSRGELGGPDPGGYTLSRTPITVPGLTGVIDVSAGSSYTCAALSGGSVKCWGRNANGELGKGVSSPMEPPVTAANVNGAISIAVNNAVSCALIVDGTMRCWGFGGWGSMGRGTLNPDNLTPAPPTNVSGVIAIDVGTYHVCALLANGRVSCWGDDGEAALGFVSETRYVSTAQSVPGRLSTAMVAAGSGHACALSALGVVQCWGRNTSGQLGIDDPSIDNVNTPRTLTLSGVLEISAGNEHTCAVMRTGTVECWGANNQAQLGNIAAGAAAFKPIGVIGLNGAAVSVSAGGGHSCAVMVSGSIMCWGTNTNGQLGDNSNTLRQQAVPVVGISTAVRVSAGSAHTCAVLAQGTARCWGAGGGGELGNHMNEESWIPVPVKYMTSSGPAEQTGVVDVVARYAGSCVLLKTGAVACWGWNGYGQLGREGPTAWGIAGNTASAYALQGVSSLGPGSNHAAHYCAVLNDATARCWGANDAGQLGNGTTFAGTTWQPALVQGLAGATQVSVGFAHSCALLTDGSAKCWGFGGDGQLGNGSFATPQKTAVPVTGFKAGTRSRFIDAGAAHTCAVLDTGKARCWGAGGSGRIGDGTTANRLKPVAPNGDPSSIAAISAGGSHTCAVLAAGTVRCWGSNTDGQLGDGTQTDRSVPGSVPGLSQVKEVSAGGKHTCALIANGTVKCWGRNASGQLGDRTTTLRKAPVSVLTSSGSLLTGVASISAGTDHTCAVMADGTARCWGAGGSGRLGNGASSNALSPVTVSGVSTSTSPGSRFTAISAGASHTCARVGNGTVRCWGYNGYGRLGDGSTTNRSTPVAASGLTGVASISIDGAHNCAQLVGGTVKCWGYNGYGRLGDGTSTARSTPVTVSGLTGATAISAGGAHTCAVLATGQLRCWGLNSSGQLGNGSTSSASTPKVVVLL